jgi:HlyD family secretion protein
VRYDETRLEAADIKSAVHQRGYESAAPAAASAGDGHEGHTAPDAPPVTPAPAAPITAPVAPTATDTASAGTAQQDRAAPSASVAAPSKIATAAPGPAAAPTPATAAAPAPQAPAAATAKPVDTAVPEAAAAAAANPSPTPGKQPAPPAGTANLPEALPAETPKPGAAVKPAPAEAPKSLLQRLRPWFIALVIAVVLAGLAFGIWWWFLREKPSDGITLYGNVDIRQVSLAFNANERVAEMRASEGERVKQGQILGVLVTTTLKLHLAQAQAQSGIQEQALRRLQAGSRPQEISQARAGVAAAQAEATKASQQYQRLQAITLSTAGRAVSRQDLDAAISAQAVTRAQLDNARKTLELAVVGPRKEDIEQARAQLDAARAELGVLKQQLADAELKSPIDAVVRSRLLEPGDMATPQRPAYALAITNPVWVRAYISETDLGRVKPGEAARVVTDSHPDQALSGCVGYISSVAEFTPKTVQTAELRTSLVYEIRIYVDDPDNRLRQGMPATVRLPTDITLCAKPDPLGATRHE